MKTKLTTEEEYRKRVAKVVEYIGQHLDEKIDLIQLAEISHFSLFHFHRIMKGYLGEAIGSYIVRERNEAAARMLRYTDETISNIAYSVGYETPSSLSKSFHKYYGITPSNFRLTKNYKLMKEEKQSKSIKLSRGKVMELPNKQVIYIAEKGNYSQIDYGTQFQRLWQEVKTQGLFTAGIEHLGFYYDSPEVTEDVHLKSDICLRVIKEAQPNGEIAVKTIPGGMFAQFTYIGPYHEIGAAYDRIYGELLAKLGYEPREHFCFEKYISNPQRVIPEKLKTEIYIPVQ